MLYRDMGDFLAAEPLLKRALAGAEKAFGPDHPNTLGSVGNLAGLYADQRRFPDAVPLLERAIQGYAKRPEMAEAVPVIRGDLGVALLATGKPADAEAHLLAGSAALSKRKTLSPANHARLRQVTQSLVELYDATNRPAKAAEWRAKLAALPPEPAPPPRAVK